MGLKLSSKPLPPNVRKELESLINQEITIRIASVTTSYNGLWMLEDERSEEGFIREFTAPIRKVGEYGLFVPKDSYGWNNFVMYNDDKKGYIMFPVDQESNHVPFDESRDEQFFDFWNVKKGDHVSGSWKRIDLVSLSHQGKFIYPSSEKLEGNPFFALLYKTDAQIFFNIINGKLYRQYDSSEKQEIDDERDKNRYLVKNDIK